MVKRLALLCVMLLAAGQGAAQSFNGRAVTVMDGRANSAPAPLVILLHGALGRGSQIARDSGFARLANEFGVLAIAPDGQRRRWQDGRQGPDTSDVTYLSALIEHYVAQGLADPNRVYLIGHSNGGGMAMRMACDRPDLVAGIAVVATKVLRAYPCANGAATPAVFFHGTDDAIAPHSGRPDGHRLGATYSAAQSLQIWSDRNGCGSARAPRRIDAREDGTALAITTYAGCRAPLMHVVIEGGGHGWPGSGRSGRLSGVVTREIDAGRASLRFLLR